MQRVYMIAVLALLLGACTTFNPTGTWQLQSPNGSTSTVTVQDFGDGNYYLHGSPLMNGIYRIDKTKFVCKKPDDPRLTGFAWHIQDNNKLVLISQPPVWVSQERYLGSLLTRP